jgi:Kef-type K+ transport system membrane component KefB
MHHVAEALLALGGAFLVCGLLARAGVPIGLPTIPLFILAGVLLGPNTPGFVLIGEPADLELVARLGLVFLLLYLGLEFSLAQLTSGGRRLATAATVYLCLNIGGGLVLGFALGWGTSEAFVIAGIVGISSSAIVTKLLIETRRLGNPETRVILGIVVIEDLFLAFYLALLQPVLGGASGLLEAALGAGVAFAFLLVLSVVARHGTRWVSALMRTKDEEIVVVLGLGLAITTAGAGEQLGVSDAIGAFMIGLTLLTRGEFSLVLASPALAAGLDARLGSFAAGYVLVLAVLGPIAVYSSPRLARGIPHRLLAGGPEPAGRSNGVPLDLDVGTSSLHELGTDLLQVRVLPGSRMHGVHMNELRLPGGATPGLLARDGTTAAVAPHTRLRTGDVLLVFTRPDQRPDTERRILAVHRSGRLAHWLGDTAT